LFCLPNDDTLRGQTIFLFSLTDTLNNGIIEERTETSEEFENSNEGNDR